MAGLKPYDPRYLPARIYLNANENPFGMPQPVSARLSSELAAQTGSLSLNRYPSPLADSLRQRLATDLGLEPSQLLLGNGGDELIADLIFSWGGPGRRLLIAPPCFATYTLSAALNGTEVVNLPRGLDMMVDEAALLDSLALGDIDIVMLASPNNPTAECLSAEFVRRMLAATDAPVLIDQAYVEFADVGYDLVGLLAEYPNLAILRTFSKFWGLAGLRLGYLCASEQLVAELLKVRQPYTVDRFAPLAAHIVLDARDLYHEQLRRIISERTRLRQAFGRRPWLEVFPSEANFLLLRLEEGRSPELAARLWQWLYDQHGILLRDFSSEPGLQGCLRVSIGTEAENDTLLAALTEFEQTGLAAGTDVRAVDAYKEGRIAL
ncbi:MAG: histidinol-phosphate transaminase [Actinomycetia bacterium]|nr:histidinol-phosphate transaminase [Actinomycetes bacterium]